MSINTCIVTGTFYDALNSPLSGVIVKFNFQQPFFHPTTNAMILNYEVTATSGNTGMISVPIIETTTPNVSCNISIYYPAGQITGNLRQDYTAIIPNQTTADLSALITIPMS